MTRQLTTEDIQALQICGIPSYMHGGIIRYCNEGILPGNFLCAVISNDLKGAVNLADDTNVTLLPNYVRWFYNYAPAGSWGSRKAMIEYCNQFNGENDVD